MNAISQPLYRGEPQRMIELRVRVLNAFNGSPLSRRQISDRTGLNSITVSAVLMQLEYNGAVVYRYAPDGSGGYDGVFEVVA